MRDAGTARRWGWAGRALAVAMVVCAGLVPGVAAAQEKIKFQLDWRFEGPSSLFLLTKAKGYFAQEKLDVEIDAGSGSGNAVNRVASGAYQMGFADLAALIEFVGNNPTAPTKPVAVMMLYDASPAAVISLKKTGIKAPADLQGKKMGAPVFDAGRKAFPIFVKANKLDASKIAWTAMDPPLRETMLVRGDVDAITGFNFTSLLNLNARGVKDEDIDVMMYPQHGVDLYSNAIIVSESFLREKPEAVRGFLRAMTRGVRDVLADPEGSIRYVKERDPLIDEALEKRRMKLAIPGIVDTQIARTDGLGDVRPQRLADMVTQVSAAFDLKSPVKPEQIWNGSYLPPKAERMVFAK